MILKTLSFERLLNSHFPVCFTTRKKGKDKFKGLNESLYEAEEHSEHTIVKICYLAEANLNPHEKLMLRQIRSHIQLAANTNNRNIKYKSGSSIKCSIEERHGTGFKKTM